MADVKQIKVKANIIFTATSDVIISKEKEDDIIIQAEQKLNSLAPLNIIIDDQPIQVGVRVHIQGKA